MRRIIWMVAIVLCVSLVLAGCGKKSVEGVVEDLEQVLGKMNSYKASGSMLLHTGQEPLEYQVEVWFQDPHYYRIALTNKKKDITQIVLRNDDGVFVLTPHLNKSFRFQSDWPDHQGQVYLYQTLAKSILKDNERLFTVEKDSKSYVFDVAANYDNSSLVRQKIWLNQHSYAPEHVEISDQNANVMVVVEYDHFEFDKEFEKDSFEMERNMTSWNLQSLEVMALDEVDGEADEEANENMEGENTEGAEGENTEGTEDENTEGTNNEVDETDVDLGKVDSYFGVLTPLYTPEGVERVDVREMTLGDEQAVLLRYEGEYDYSIVEAWPQTHTESILPGTIVDLQFTQAVLLGTETKMLRWINDGIEFKLSTKDLPQSEMVKIAKSVQGQIGK